MKCTHCIEGKLLPLLINKPIDPTKYPNCDYCNGTGIHKERNERFVYEGKLLNDMRISSGVNMRKFCIENRLDAVQISKIERGLRECPDNIRKVYEQTYK
jgi:hypothetical protein